MATVAVPEIAAAPPAPRARFARWEFGVLSAGVAAAVVAVIVTLQADFLAYPGWLAVQKADLILGPIGVGLYWLHRRPQSRFGPLLIAIGFVHVPYILQSSDNSAFFTLAVHWEGVIYLATLALILTFPSGRPNRRIDRLILVVAALGVVAPSSAISLFSPQISAGGSISACKGACPENALLISSQPSLVERLVDIDRAAIIAVALGTAALLVWRLVAGTPPQRRALAVGTPIALAFLLTQATFQITSAVGHTDLALNEYVRWTFVVARSALWYGFLFALIAAELFEAHVLRRIVDESLRRPPLRELEALLRRPLGDPRLRLAYWEERRHAWQDGDGNVLEPPAPDSGRALTEVDLEGVPAVAIVHDVQLGDDPELLHAAGATALLALENAKLHEAWEESMRELRSSRARIVTASANERLRLERDLHDGAQQRLFTAQIKLAAIRDDTRDSDLVQALESVDEDVSAAIDECRTLAHGLYPTVLRERGLVDALRAVARGAGLPVRVVDHDIPRASVTAEEAVYFCTREAIQNATKHAGPGTHVTVTLAQDGDRLWFAVADDGAGFDSTQDSDGLGITSMHDRVGAVGGTLEIVSQPGQGTEVRGTVPMRGAYHRFDHVSLDEVRARAAATRARSEELIRKLRAAEPERSDPTVSAQ